MVPVGIEWRGRRASMAFIEMIVDTGTNRSGISEEVAMELGIDFNHLPLGPVGGITSAAMRPMCSELAFWVGLGDIARVEMPKVMVLGDVVLPAKVVAGGTKRRKQLKSGGMNLFGMDALRLLKADLKVTTNPHGGRIQW